MLGKPDRFITKTCQINLYRVLEGTRFLKRHGDKQQFWGDQVILLKLNGGLLMKQLRRAYKRCLQIMDFPILLRLFMYHKEKDYDKL